MTLRRPNCDADPVPIGRRASSRSPMHDFRQIAATRLRRAGHRRCRRRRPRWSIRAWPSACARWAWHASDDYCALWSTARRASDERQQMIAALTTNVTRFFREPHHFEHLQRQGPAAAGRQPRAAAARCASGRPPARAARSPIRSRLTVLSVMPERRSLDVKILATDIDPECSRARPCRASIGEAALEAVSRDAAQPLVRAGVRTTASAGRIAARRLRRWSPSASST